MVIVEPINKLKTASEALLNLIQVNGVGLSVQDKTVIRFRKPPWNIASYPSPR